MPVRAVPVTRPRAVAYIRVSQERDDMISPELQETAIRDHCARNGYEVVETLIDLDMSGRFWKRRQVEQALAMIEAHEAEIIVVWKMSRVSRNRLDWNIAVDRIETVGGRLESATEPIDTSTSSGRFSRGILAELAAFESERAGEQWQEAHARRWRNGLPHSGRPRLGYIYARETGYQQDPDIAPIVRGMYERFIAGDTFLAIARWLAPMNLGTMTTHKSIADFMDAGFAAGLIRHHDPDCAVHTGKNCRNRVTDQGAHEPIITTEQWTTYLELRRARRFVPPRLKMPLTAFAGMIYCTACGWRYVHHRRNDHGSDQYRCGNSQSCPAVAAISRAKIETQVLEWLPEVAAEVNAQGARTNVGENTARAERDRLNRVAIEADKALVQLSKDFARRIIPESAYLAARDELTTERDSAAARASQIAQSKAQRVHARKVAVDLLAAWPHMSEPGRNRVLKELLVIHVTPTKGAPEAKLWPAWNAPELARIPRK